jgi:hypothetical protein
MITGIYMELPMSKKSKMQTTAPESPSRPQGFNEEAIRNFQLSNTKGEATEVEFVDGKLRLVYRS